MKFPKPTKVKKKHLSKKIDNYDELFAYVYSLWGYMCPIAASKGVRDIMPGELHHRLHRAKNNRIRFPLFIDSAFNVVAVSEKYHTENRNWGKYSVYQADKIEQYIIEHIECLEMGYFSSREELESVIGDILG